MSLLTLWVFLFPCSPFLCLHLLTLDRRERTERTRPLSLTSFLSNVFPFVSSLCRTINKSQPTPSLNDPQPLTPPIEALAFIYPLKSTQNSKHHKFPETPLAISAYILRLELGVTDGGDGFIVLATSLPFFPARWEEHWCLSFVLGEGEVRIQGWGKGPVAQLT